MRLSRKLPFVVQVIWISLSVFGGLGVASSQEISDLTRLKGQVSRAGQAWPEGKLKCTVRSAFGGTVISACWAGETVRLDYSKLTFGDTDPVDNEEAASNLISMRNRRFVFFCDKSNDVAVLKRSSDADLISQPLRVLPNETWNEITPGQSITKWLNLQSQDPEVTIDCSAINEAGWKLKLSGKEESVFEVTFSRHGMLQSAHTISALPDQGRLHIDVTWDDRTTPPRPVRYVQSVQASESAKDEIMLEMTMEAFENKADGVNLDFPPADLPFGVRVSDERGQVRRDSFVGGELGKQQYLLKKMASQIRKPD